MNKPNFHKIIKNWDKDEFERYQANLEKMYIEYRNHPILQKWLLKYPKTEEEIKKNMIAIKQMIIEEEQANILSSLDMTNGKTHYQSLDENFNVVMKTYPFLQKLQKKTEHVNNYIRYKPDEKLLLANLVDIIKEGNIEIQGITTTIHRLYTEKKGVYLFGNMGVGKTYLMYAFLNFLINDENKKVMAVRINQLITDFELRKRNLDEFQVLLNQVINAEILLLDDIGSEIVDDFSRDSILFTILDERMRRNKITYFTSNLDFPQLEMHYAHEKFNVVSDDKALRILERIKTLTQKIVLTGKNRRY